jgi:isopenicillin-N epimerase
VLPIPNEPEIDLTRLWQQFRIEAPLIDWNGRKFVRISVQAYTTPTDIDRLVEAIGAIVVDR